MYNGHPAGSSFYFDDAHHERNGPAYHRIKDDIDLEDFDDVIEELHELIKLGSIWETDDPLAALQHLLDGLKEVIDVDLPQDWLTLLPDLKSAGAEHHPVDTNISFLHCPKGVSNGAEKTSSTGLAKCVGIESALHGIGFS
jgi:hypothetical protein